MKTLINYAIEANLGLLLFYALYLLLLRKETDFRANRIYLLASIAASLVFPLFSLTEGVQPNVIPTVDYLLPELIVGSGASLTTPAVGKTFSITSALFYSYTAVTSLLLLFFLFQLIRLVVFLSGQPSRQVNGIHIIETNRPMPPFSFFKWVVIGTAESLSEAEKEQIVTHERAHAQQWHSADLLLVHLLRVIFWFNPVVWLYKSTLSQLHEFEADQQSTDEKSLLPYCTLLAKVAMAQSGFAMAHHFNKSLTLKRIKMMNTLKQQMKRWKVVVAFATSIIFFVTVSCQDQLNDVKTVNENSTMALVMPAKVTEKLNEMKATSPSAEFVVVQLNDEGKKVIQRIPSEKITRLEILHEQNEETKEMESFMIMELNEKITAVLEQTSTGDIFTIVEESATPEGGIEAFFKFIAQEIKYPAEARQKGIEGRVFVEFIVNKDGTISNVKPVKGIGAGCDEEAARVVSLSPTRWNPGKQRGQVVRQRMVLPITFKMDNKQQGAIILEGVRSSNSKFNVEITHTANSKQITGSVKDENGDPLAGVNIVVAGTTQGTITNTNGNFSITPSASGGRLVFSFIGYETKEVTY